MQYDNKTTRSVADAAAKIMSEKLHPNQQKLDVHEPEKDELTAQDFKKLRAMKKEETEQLQEYETDKNGRYVHKGTYGGAKGSEYGSTEWDKEEKMKDEKQKPARRKYGARQNYKRSTRVNESFSDLVESLQGGLKNFEQQLQEWKSKKVMKEEPDNEQFTKEVEKQKAKAAGTAPQADIAKASVQAVQNEETHTTVEVIDLDPINGVKTATIDLEERSLTEPEMKKREEVVKSMKKKMAGFKERYGDRAKEVMYATATKVAKKD